MTKIQPPDGNDIVDPIYETAQGTPASGTDAAKLVTSPFLPYRTHKVPGERDF